MIATAADGPCPGAYTWGAAAALPTVPPPVAVTVTMALTSRPPSGRNSFWYTSTENCGTLDFEKLAMPAHTPLVPRRGGAMTVDGPVPTGPSGLPRTRPRAPLAVL